MLIILNIHLNSSTTSLYSFTQEFHSTNSTQTSLISQSNTYSQISTSYGISESTNQTPSTFISELSTIESEVTSSTAQASSSTLISTVISHDFVSSTTLDPTNCCKSLVCNLTGGSCLSINASRCVCSRCFHGEQCDKRHTCSHSLCPYYASSDTCTQQKFYLNAEPNML